MCMVSAKEFKKTTGIHITEKMNGKMEGMQSLSTSSLCNPICIERAKDPDSICSKCYANSMQEMYSNLAKCLAKNTEILTTVYIPSSVWFRVNASVFRLEAFGDVQNVLQMRNYIAFCNANPHCNFTLWTKNPSIVDKAIKQDGKPNNLMIGVSSPHVNTVVNVSKYEWVDFVFTVYTFIYATQHSIRINCGNRRCLECSRCYTKAKDGKVFYVNEILKSDSKKYYAWLAKRQATAEQKTA